MSGIGVSPFFRNRKGGAIPPFYSQKVVQYCTSQMVQLGDQYVWVDRRGADQRTLQNGRCYDFSSDATAYVDFPKANIDLSSSTYEHFEVDFEKAAGETCAYNQGDDADNRMQMLWFSDNNIYFNIANGSNSYALVALTDYSKHTIKCIFDGSGAANADRCKIWVDGVAQTLSFTGTIPASLPTFTNTFQIGKNYSTAYANAYQGNVKRFDSSGNLINQWLCDEDTGADCFDSVGSANGTITNATLGTFHVDNINFRSYQNEFGYTDDSSVLKPLRYDSDGNPTTLDIDGNTPTYIGRARNDIKAVQSNCLEGGLSSARAIDTGLTMTGGSLYRFDFRFKTDSALTTAQWLFGAFDTDKGGVSVYTTGAALVRIQSSSKGGGDTNVITTITLSTSTWYEGYFIYDGATGDWSIQFNTDTDSGTAELETWSGASTEDLCCFNQFTGKNNSFGGVFDFWQVTKDGTKIIDYTFSEGNGATVYDRSGNGNDGTLTTFTLPTDWIQDDGATPHNLINGFDKWEDDGTPGSFIYVPYDVDGTPILTTGDSLTGYTWVSTHPKIDGKQFHNGAETEALQYLVPELWLSDGTDQNWFNSSGVPQNATYADIDGMTVNPTYSDISEYPVKEQTQYTTDLAGAEKTRADTYFKK
jgi:hypothetical protein